VLDGHHVRTASIGGLINGMNIARIWLIKDLAHDDLATGPRRSKIFEIPAKLLEARACH